MDIEIRKFRQAENIDDFEKTLCSMREIAKQRGITRQDVAVEITLHKKK